MPTNKVKGIKYGTMAQYNAMASHEQNTLYFITDKGLLYRGSSIVVPVNVTTHTAHTAGSGPDAYTDCVHFRVETYGADPSNPDVLEFDVYSQAAVDAAIATLSTAIAEHAATLADATTYGHVRLSDTADATLDADEHVAATPKAVADAIQAAMGDMAGAMRFKGTLGTTGTVQELPTTGVQVGDTYRVATAGTYASQACEVGDLVICIGFRGSGENAFPQWTVAQNNIDGAVTAEAALAQDQLVVAAGDNRTVKKLPAGTAGQMLVIDANLKPAWRSHVIEDHGTGYGTCATAAGTAAKVVTLSGYELVKGGIVAVKFTYAVPANATMNVNAKGAKQMWWNGARIAADVIKAGDVATFAYDGSYYQLLAVNRPPQVPTSLTELDNDLIGYGTCATAAATLAKTVDIGNIDGTDLSLNQIVAVRFVNDVPASSTLAIGSNGDAYPIHHRGAAIATGVIRAGDVATMIARSTDTAPNVAWEVLAVSRGFDDAPTDQSHALVDSNAVYQALQDVYEAIEEATLFWEPIGG